MTNSSNRNTSAGYRRSQVHREPEAHAAYLFRKLSRMLRANRSVPDAKSVHQLRTTVRRIETLAASLGEQDSKAYAKFEKLLSDIFDKAGKVRDLDVQIEALNTISLPSVTDDKALLLNYLQRQRGKRQRKFAERVDQELAKRLPKRQRRAKALLLETVKWPGTPRQTIDLRREVEPFLDKLRANHFDTESLHEFRLDVKHVRYAAEVAGAQGEEIVALLKPVQDAIGVWHDWLNLTRTAEKVLGPLPGHPLMAILRGKVRGRFNDAITVLQPLESQLTDVMQLKKHPGPVLLVGENHAVAATAS